jgi:hypothetical protein
VAIGMAATACSYGTEASRGTTAQKYSGRIEVVFTNASPDTMCGLYMSDDHEDQYGDNWLPASGLKSGQSVKFWVKKGSYKARWDTCRSSQQAKFFAGTMCSQMAIDIADTTQLFAYVADKVAPTKRAATLGNGYKLVRFPGQAVEPIGTAHDSRRVAAVEMSHTERAIMNNERPAATESAPVEKVDMSSFVEAKPVKKTAIKKMKPSTARTQDPRIVK